MEPKKVQLNNNTTWMSTVNPHSHSHWTFCAKDPKKDVYNQVTNLTICRESLTSYLKDNLLSVYANNIEKDRTVIMCLLMPGKEMFGKVKRQVRNIFRNGVNLVNFFERSARFGLTKAYEVKVLGGPKGLKSHGQLFIGPKVWMQNPYALSIYVMLLRLGKYPQFENVRSYKQFCRKSGSMVKMMEDFITEGDVSHVKDLFFWPRAGSHDVFHLFLTADKIMPFLKNLDRFFGNRKRTSIFKASDVYHDGFSALCRADTRDSDLNTVFKQFCTSKKLELEPLTLSRKLAKTCNNAAAGDRRVAAYDDYYGKDFY